MVAEHVKRMIARIEGALGKRDAGAILAELVADGARHRFAGGTNFLRIAGIEAQSTAGGVLLLRAWCRRARKWLEAQPC